MERGLHERDRVGLQDFVLLENYKSEEAFIDNLRKRFQENLIYVSILKCFIWELFWLEIVYPTDIYRSSVDLCESLQGPAYLLR